MDTLTLKINHQATIYPLSAHDHQRLVEQIARRLTFKNPQWTENERRGFLNFDTPECICGYELFGDRLIVGLVQSLYKCAGEVAPFIGHLGGG